VQVSRRHRREFVRRARIASLGSPLAAAAMHPRGYAAAARSLSLRRRTARLCSSSCWCAGCPAYCIGGSVRNAASVAGFSLPSRDNVTFQWLFGGGVWLLPRTAFFWDIF